MAFCTCDHLEEDGSRRDSPAHRSREFYLNFHRRRPQLALQLQLAQDFAYNAFIMTLLRGNPANALIPAILAGGGGGYPERMVRTGRRVDRTDRAHT